VRPSSARSPIGSSKWSTGLRPMVLKAMPRLRRKSPPKSKRCASVSRCIRTF